MDSWHALSFLRLEDGGEHSPWYLAAYRGIDRRVQAGRRAKVWDTSSSFTLPIVHISPRMPCYEVAFTPSSPLLAGSSPLSLWSKPSTFSMPSTSCHNAVSSPYRSMRLGKSWTWLSWSLWRGICDWLPLTVIKPSIRFFCLFFALFTFPFFFLQDGQSFDDHRLAHMISQLMRSGVYVAVVTAAGYKFDVEKVLLSSF